MYTSHFGLTEPPFSIAPDPRYLYMSERHREGLAHLLYGIGQPAGFVQLTGEVGTGKTTLCRCLLAQLPPDVDVAFVLNPRLTALELLATVCDELGISTYPFETKSVKVLVDLLHRHLLEAHGQGRRTVLIIDEVQNLSADVLEQIRLLTNLETTTEKLLQIILIGQPELARLLDRRRLPQLAQRITARYHLLPLSRPETCAYIHHRLRVAGGSDTLFTPAAMRRTHRWSRGVPRMINVICDRALLGAYAHEQDHVDATTVRRAGREVSGRVPGARRGGRFGRAFGLGAVGVALAGTAIVLTPSRIFHPGDEGMRPAVSRDAEPTAVTSATGETPLAHEGGRAGPTLWEVTVPQGGIGATGHRTPASPSLVRLLADPSVGDDADAAFASLYSRWGVEYRRGPAGPTCEMGRSTGLDCLSMVGSWNKLRRFDLPAILELDVPTAGKYRVPLVALGEETATLELGGREYALPLREIDRFWDGDFLLLWKAAPVGSRLISPGMRGKGVGWLRGRLDELEGRVGKVPDPGVYDEALKRHVQDFQRSRSLIPDGLVGGETLAQLTLAIRDPGAPSLSRRSP
ncbi:MAG: AAA family ATPase [Candidatus Methylomirabilota bacterium]